MPGPHLFALTAAYLSGHALGCQVGLAFGMLTFPSLGTFAVIAGALACWYAVRRRATRLPAGARARSLPGLLLFGAGVVLLASFHFDRDPQAAAYILRDQQSAMRHVLSAAAEAL